MPEPTASPPNVSPAADVLRELAQQLADPIRLVMAEWYVPQVTLAICPACKQSILSGHSATCPHGAWLRDLRRLLDLVIKLPPVARNYDDAMIAHRWFAEHYGGEVMNGRDFRVKCDIADTILQTQLRLVADLRDVLVGLIDLDGPAGDVGPKARARYQNLRAQIDELYPDAQTVDPGEGG